MMITLRRGGVLKDSSKIIKINSYYSQILHSVIYYTIPLSPYHLSPYHSTVLTILVLTNFFLGPLSNFVDRGLGEWEWLGLGVPTAGD